MAWIWQCSSTVWEQLDGNVAMSRVAEYLTQPLPLWETSLQLLCGWDLAVCWTPFGFVSTLRYSTTLQMDCLKACGFANLEKAVLLPVRHISCYPAPSGIASAMDYTDIQPQAITEANTAFTSACAFCKIDFKETSSKNCVTESELHLRLPSKQLTTAERRQLLAASQQQCPLQGFVCSSRNNLVAALLSHVRADVFTASAKHRPADPLLPACLLPGCLCHVGLHHAALCSLQALWLLLLQFLSQFSHSMTK